MQYILMLYVNEAEWPKLSRAEQEHGPSNEANEAAHHYSSDLRRL